MFLLGFGLDFHLGSTCGRYTSSCVCMGETDTTHLPLASYPPLLCPPRQTHPVFEHFLSNLDLHTSVFLQVCNESALGVDLKLVVTDMIPGCGDLKNSFPEAVAIVMAPTKDGTPKG